MNIDEPQKPNNAWILTGEQIMDMQINNRGDVKNLAVGINNFVSEIASNSVLLSTIGASVDPNHPTWQFLDTKNAGITLQDGVFGIKKSELGILDSDIVRANSSIEFSKSVTTLFAYGQAVQDFPNLVFQKDNSINTSFFNPPQNQVSWQTLNKDSLHTVPPLSIESPFLFEPRKIETEKIIEVMPEVKKNLPEKRIEAIQLLEYINNPDTKNDDVLVVTDVAELKRAVKVIYDSLGTFLKTTQTVVVSKTEFSVKTKLVEELKVGPLEYREDGAIYFKQKPLEMRSQIKTLCILFMQKHKQLVDYSVIKDEIIPAPKRSTTDWNTITKYVSELHLLLQKHFNKKVIFNHEKDGYFFDIERNS